MLPEGVEIIDFNNNVITEREAKARFGQLNNLIADNKKFQEFRRDVLLLGLLHRCKFNVENAYAKFEIWCKSRVENPEWHVKIPTERRRSLLDMNMRVCLAKRDRTGRMVYLAKFGNVNTSLVSLKEVVSVDMMWFEYVFADPLTQSKGVCVVIDVSGMSMKLLQWMTPTNIRLCREQHLCLPVRDIVFHIVNTSYIMDVCVKLVWPFISQKLKDTLHVHKDNWDSLHEHISPEVLPEEYGGTSTINFEELNERLQEFVK